MSLWFQAALVNGFGRGGGSSTANSAVSIALAPDAAAAQEEEAPRIELSTTDLKRTNTDSADINNSINNNSISNKSSQRRSAPAANPSSPSSPPSALSPRLFQKRGHKSTTDVVVADAAVAGDRRCDSNRFVSAQCSCHGDFSDSRTGLGCCLGGVSNSQYSIYY